MWDGGRNHNAKLNMKAMKFGGEVFFVHSTIRKECCSIMPVTQAPFPDPTADDGSPWFVVRVEPVRPLSRPVTLKPIKADPRFADMYLVRLSRLSVGRVTADEWNHILKTSEQPEG